MGSIITSCMNVVRDLPHFTALDIYWHWMEDHQLTQESIVLPTFDFKNEQKLQQTAARVFFAIILPSLAKPFGFANLGVGIAHFVWCICNINSIRKREPGYKGQEMENAFIRIAAGIYDLAIGYLLCSSIMSSIYGKVTIPFIFALAPSYAIQLHHLVFEKATKPLPEGEKNGEAQAEINHRALKVGCFIKQFCSGLVETFVPEPAANLGWKGRIMAFPSAIGNWGLWSYFHSSATP